MRRMMLAAVAVAWIGCPTAAGGEGPPEADLPRVSAAVALPQAGASVTVTIAKPGEAWADGTSFPTLDSLRAHLERRAADAGREPDGSSDLEVVIAVDAGMPFVSTLWVLQTAAHPRVKAFRTSLAVRHRASGAVGVIPLPLPRDRNFAARFPTDAPIGRVVLSAAPDGEAVAPERLYATLAALPVEERREAVVGLTCQLSPTHAVPHGYAVGVIDALRRAEVRDIRLVGTPPPQPSGDLRRALADLLARPVGVPRLAWSGSRGHAPLATAWGGSLAAVPLALPEGPGPVARSPQEELLDLLRRLERRIARIEARLEGRPAPLRAPDGPGAQPVPDRLPPPEEELPPTPEEVEQLHGTARKSPPPILVVLGDDGVVRVAEKAFPLGDPDQGVAAAARAALKALLVERTKDPALREADGTSKVELVVRGGRAARWPNLQAVTALCADPSVRIVKIRYAVEARADAALPPEEEEVPGAEVPRKPPVVEDAPLEAPVREGVEAQADRAGAPALEWLAAHQSPDGGWEAEGFGSWCNGKQVPSAPAEGRGKAQYDVGVTGLSLLAFLGAGYTNRSEGRFARVVGNGLRYLRNAQDAEGCFGSRASMHFAYNHAIATQAMVEAYGMTGSVLYKNPAQKGLDFIAIARNPYFAWRYGVKPGDNDTSVTGWMTMALVSARLVNRGALQQGKPAPFVLDEEAFEGAKAWIDKMTDPETGRVGYQQRGSGPARTVEMVDKFPGDKSEAMTAVGMLVRILLGENPKQSDPVQRGAGLCENLLPRWDPDGGTIDMDYWYFGTLAMYQVGGEPWKKWEAAMKAAIVDTQRRDGDFCAFKGSWDPIDPWGPEGGRVYATAMMALCLEVWYRYDDPAPGVVR